MATLDDLLRLSKTMEPEKHEMLLQYAHELMKTSADTSAPVPSPVDNTLQFAQGFRDRDETIRLVCEKLLALDENDISNKISELSSKALWNT